MTEEPKYKNNCGCVSNDLPAFVATDPDVKLLPPDVNRVGLYIKNVGAASARVSFDNPSSSGVILLANEFLQFSHPVSCPKGYVNAKAVAGTTTISIITTSLSERF